jgi:hypothetical protein
MASTKVTIDLEAGQLARIRDLVQSGQATSGSGFVQHAVGFALDDVAGWGPMLTRALTENGGPMTADEQEWADAALGVGRHRHDPA